jgi:hypothetical protein
VTYDVFFEAGDDSPDELVSENQSGTSYDPGMLLGNTTYYRQMVARDEHGLSTAGPVWSFTTSESVLPGYGPSLAVGKSHTCALTDAGGVRCWGANGSGQLGDGTATERLSPVQVSGLTSGAVELVAGGWHTCVLTEDGAVLCWGNNAYDQVSVGSIPWRTTPVSVTGYGEDR